MFTENETRGYKKQKQADRIRSDIDRFIDGGGKITVIPFGVSANPEVTKEFILKSKKGNKKRWSNR